MAATRSGVRCARRSASSISRARGKKLSTHLHPDEVVALGASGPGKDSTSSSTATDDLLLLDVTPLSLGIEALGGIVAKIMGRNSTYAVRPSTSPSGSTAAEHCDPTFCRLSAELAKDPTRSPGFHVKGTPRSLLDFHGISR